MEWSEHKKADGEVSNYNHVTSETPLGTMIIEWKSWKEQSGYELSIQGGEWLGVAYSLENAKKLGISHLQCVMKALFDYLK